MSKENTFNYLAWRKKDEQKKEYDITLTVFKLIYFDFTDLASE